MLPDGIPSIREGGKTSRMNVCLWVAANEREQMREVVRMQKKGILRLTVTGFALPLLEANGFFSHSFSRSKDGAHGVVALLYVCD